MDDSPALLLLRSNTGSEEPAAGFVREQKPRGRARTAARVLLVRGCGSER